MVFIYTSTRLFWNLNYLKNQNIGFLCQVGAVIVLLRFVLVWFGLWDIPSGTYGIILTFQSEIICGCIYRVLYMGCWGQTRIICVQHKCPPCCPSTLATDLAFLFLVSVFLTFLRVTIKKTHSIDKVYVFEVPTFLVSVVLSSPFLCTR